MAPDMWLFLGITGLLTAVLSGLPSPVPSGQHRNDSTPKTPVDPEEQLGIRLVNGSSRCSGSVEVLLESWEPVCAAHWNWAATKAVCNALGCGDSGKVTYLMPPTSELPSGASSGNTSSSGNTTWARAPTVRCSGAHWQLCKVEDQECGGDRPLVWVTCAENQAVRLVDGGSRCAGRVEMLEHGEWGTVCDDTWDLEDAHVVCKQLKCGWAVKALAGLHFTPGQGPIHRDQVNCSGTETYLWDCPGRPGDQYCGHKEDAGVVCSEHQSWRLTGGVDSCEGQVEVFFRGVWSTVCDSEWYTSEAKVLCRSLGCGSEVDRPRGLPHSLEGRMYYSCEGEEIALSSCSWRFNNSNLCSQSLAARVVCSGSQRHPNLSTSEVPSRIPVTRESSVLVSVKDKDSQELTLLIPCIVLGSLLFISLIFIAILLLRAKGRYALPASVNHQQLSTDNQSGINNYHPVPITIAKEAPTLFFQPRVPEDSDSSSDSDYEHYDFSSQPPVALTTFYNSQRHRVTEEEAQQNRFRMPPLEEGLEELHVSHTPPADPRPCVAEAPSLGSQYHMRSNSDSSTSSEEGYCNDPSSKPPPWNSQAFSSEKSPLTQQPPNLELAGSQAVFSAGPSANDSSSTSSGEWYQNFQLPPQHPPVEQFECPGPPDPQANSIDDDEEEEEDYDDIGAA
ncbi:T-cell differentiation antigen CD6 isoform X1 [Apodemus sylvaticus]|uniref:T-cell differentiation antigen CD6 isoform X1 n=1 Tax=Apodemus sylvaticus TaxID=10129 RepID=UPI002241A63A|nr:T-cell differentiation antigen CD6 isoform X1 [Apodemus sylvaticus]